MVMSQLAGGLDDVSRLPDSMQIPFKVPPFLAAAESVWQGTCLAQGDQFGAGAVPILKSIMQ